jgi:hypothetical protein
LVQLTIRNFPTVKHNWWSTCHSFIIIKVKVKLSRYRLADAKEERKQLLLVLDLGTR